MLKSFKIFPHLYGIPPTEMASEYKRGMIICGNYWIKNENADLIGSKLKKLDSV